MYTSRLPGGKWQFQPDGTVRLVKKGFVLCKLQAETSCTLAYYPFLCQDLPSVICLASVLTDPLKGFLESPPECFPDDQNPVPSPYFPERLSSYHCLLLNLFLLPLFHQVQDFAPDFSSWMLQGLINNNCNLKQIAKVYKSILRSTMYFFIENDIFWPKEGGYVPTCAADLYLGYGIFCHFRKMSVVSMAFGNMWQSGVLQCPRIVVLILLLISSESTQTMYT